MRLRIDSSGKFIDKDKYPLYDRGKQIERLIELTNDDPRLNYLLASRQAGVDAIIQPIKRVLDTNDKLIRFKLDEPKNPKLKNIVFDEITKKWYELSLYVLFVSRNEVDGVYGKIEEKMSNYYPLSSVLDAVKKRSFVLVNEINYEDTKTFILHAEEFTEDIPKRIKAVYDKLKDALDNCIGSAAIYQTYGQEMNKYLYYYCDAKPIESSKLWEEYKQFKSFLSENGCEKILYDKTVGEISFYHLYVSKRNNENNRIYNIYLKEDNGKIIYLLSDGSIFSQREKIFTYLKNSLTNNNLETRFYKWFGNLNEERDAFDDAIRQMQGKITIKQERLKLFDFKF